MATSIINNNQNKIALIIATNYPNTNNQLNGCINDANNIHAFLLTIGFAQNEIIMITDEYDTIEGRAPIRQNIELALVDIARRTHAENGPNLVWVSYSGHGAYQFDNSGDETDGRDEVLCPRDCDTAGMISDDWIKAQFIMQLAPQCTMIGLFDCCHSGTICDLPYTYNRKIAADKRPIFGGTNIAVPAARAYTISGCRDSQTSADAYIASKYSGAMTWAFLQVMKDPANRHLNLMKITDKMRKLLAAEYTQYPVLSACRESEFSAIFIDEIATQDESPSSSFIGTLLQKI